MIANINLSLNLDYVIKKVTQYAPLLDMEVTKAWYDDEDIIFKVKTQGKKLKLKFRIISYKDTYLAIRAKSVVVNGWLKIGGTPLSIAVNLAKKMIERSLPFATIKVEGGIVYLENILTNEVKIEQSCLKTRLFINEQ